MCVYLYTQALHTRHQMALLLSVECKNRESKGAQVQDSFADIKFYVNINKIYKNKH